MGSVRFFPRFDRFVPGVREFFGLLAAFFAGVLLGNALALSLTYIVKGSLALELQQLVSYPVMFLPPMLFAAVRSRRAGYTKAVCVDSGNFAPSSGAVLACLASVLVLMAAFVADGAVSLLPEMPESLRQALEAMTSGNIAVNLLSVSVFAPFFEEWLCRGTVLRGMLARGVKPGPAIALSALFFAVIHANPWQAVPAFILGCLFGYVYYRTGSLKLTMLMHCVNNTFSIIVSRIDALDGMDSWLDVMPLPVYLAISLVFVLCSILILRRFSGTRMKDPRGNFDIVEP